MYIGLRILTAAHMALLASALLFQSANGGSPLGASGFVLYALFVVAAFVGVIVVRLSQSNSRIGPLLIAALPLVASITFYVGLRGDFAPYDPFDAEVVHLHFVGAAIVLSSSALLFCSLPFLLISAATQIALYMSIYWESYQGYPGASLLGTRPSIFVFILFVYFAAGIVLAWQLTKEERPRQQHTVWGVHLLTATGSMFLLSLLAWLPASGDVLAFRLGSPQVMGGAWVWLRTAASALGKVAILYAILCVVWSLIASLLMRRNRTANATR